MVDDGTEIEGDKGVTERHITKITPYTETVAIGMPKVITEYYEDLTTQTEHLLKKVVNIYNDRNLLVEQIHYDNLDRARFTLKWDYDAHGNTILETNPLNEKIMREFDENNNMICETKEGLTTRYVYDLANRLREVHQKYRPDLTLITRHTYDFCGNLISTVDHFNNETRYSYDEFGHVIKVEGAFYTGENGELISSTTLMEYDLMGNQKLITDANGHTTTKSYKYLWQAPLYSSSRWI